MDLHEAALLGHLNLIQFYRESPAWSRTGTAHEEDGMLFFTTDSAFPVMMNGAFRTDDRLAPQAAIERTLAYFGERRRGFSLWAREGADADLCEAAEGAGMIQAMRYPEMICRNRLDERELPEGVGIRRVTRVEDVADFVEINASAYTVYGMPGEALRGSFSAPERVISPHVVAVIATVDGQPGAAAMTVASHGIAGVYWVGTLERFRGRGLGEAVTRAVTNAGFDLGARVNTLEASPMGEPIYQRMGYEHAFHYKVFFSPQPT